MPVHFRPSAPARALLARLAPPHPFCCSIRNAPPVCSCPSAPARAVPARLAPPRPAVPPKRFCRTAPNSRPNRQRPSISICARPIRLARPSPIASGQAARFGAAQAESGCLPARFFRLSGRGWCAGRFTPGFGRFAGTHRARLRPQLFLRYDICNSEEAEISGPACAGGVERIWKFRKKYLSCRRDGGRDFGHDAVA